MRRTMARVIAVVLCALALGVAIWSFGWWLAGDDYPGVALVYGWAGVVAAVLLGLLGHLLRPKVRE